MSINSPELDMRIKAPGSLHDLRSLPGLRFVGVQSCGDRCRRDEARIEAVRPERQRQRLGG